MTTFFTILTIACAIGIVCAVVWLWRTPYREKGHEEEEP